MIGYGMGGRPVPPYSWEQMRAAVKAGGDPMTEAARLQRWEHYHERFMFHKIGTGNQRVVRAATDARIEAERRLREEFGGDLLAYVESLRTPREATR